MKLAPTGAGGSGLQVSADGLSVAAGRGLALEDNSLHVDLAADPGLEFDGDTETASLRVKVNAAKALARLARFGFATVGSTTLAVRTHVPPLPQRWLTALPDYLRDDPTLAA